MSETPERKNKTANDNRKISWRGERKRASDKCDQAKIPERGFQLGCESPIKNGDGTLYINR